MTGPTIMIIDDEEDILSLMTYILSDAGYEVRTGNGVTDLFEVEKNPPDLLLIDNWLNGKTGHDICYQLKTSPKTADIPVVLISATNGLAETAKSCKADGFLRKPFELTDLLATVKGFTKAIKGL